MPVRGWTEHEALVTDTLRRHETGIDNINRALGENYAQLAVLEAAESRQDRRIADLEAKQEEDRGVLRALQIKAALIGAGAGTVFGGIVALLGRYLTK